jgi:hypothetical protein
LIGLNYRIINILSITYYTFPGANNIYGPWCITTINNGTLWTPNGSTYKIFNLKTINFTSGLSIAWSMSFPQGVNNGVVPFQFANSFNDLSGPHLRPTQFNLQSGDTNGNETTINNMATDRLYAGNYLITYTPINSTQCTITLWYNNSNVGSIISNINLSLLNNYNDVYFGNSQIYVWNINIWNNIVSYNTSYYTV